MPVFQNVSARTEKRGIGIDCLAEIDQIIFVAASPVKQQQGSRRVSFCGDETMNEAEIAHGRVSEGRVSSICSRWASYCGESFRLWPSVSTGSSAVNPGLSVAISKRMPPG